MAIGAFKKLIPGDYQVTPYKAHKTWEFTEASVDDRDINVFKGELNNITDLAARTGSDGSFTNASFFKDPKVYITTVGLYNENNELLAVAKLSKPLLKSFSKEAVIKVKLDF